MQSPGQSAKRKLRPARLMPVSPLWMASEVPSEYLVVTEMAGRAVCLEAFAASAAG
jgi:hypothetical protein